MVQGRHDREAAPAPAERPEQLRLVLCVHPEPAAVGRHDVGSDDALGREAVATGEPADPAAQAVADRPDVGGGAVQGDKTVGRRQRTDGAPLRPGLDRGRAAHRVDDHTGEARRVQQDRAIERTERAAAVAATLRGDLEPGIAGSRQRGLDIGDRLRQDHGSRMLVKGAVPREAGIGVGRVRGQDDAARQRPGQGFQGRCARRRT